ncbi:MAG: hypothetical protein QG600_305 [Patescibacteria group bacterium]|nr:hypothetical protein [Patescibacteria group bacterium]
MITPEKVEKISLDPEDTTMPSQNSRSKKFLIFGVLCVFVLGLLFFFKPKNENTQKISPQEIQTQSELESDPFYELTIPYLRSRQYESKLEEPEFYAESGNYTSYLTSYSSDGNNINSLLTIPEGEVPDGGWPAVIFIHGYIPPLQYVTTEKYVDYVDFLARNGFVVMKIDLRGHGESEGEPGGGYYGSDYIVDTLSAYTALQAFEKVNKDKIGLWGHSMAGNIIMRSMAAMPSIPAGVIWAGAVYTYVDMREYGIQDSSYQPLPTDTQRQSRRRELFEKHGTPSAESVFWQEVAPVNYLSDLEGAVQIHHAIDDNVVSIGYSRDLSSYLENESIPHELHEYVSGGHNITGGSFVTAMQRTVDFYKKYLGE